MLGSPPGPAVPARRPRGGRAGRRARPADGRPAGQRGQRADPAHAAHRHRRRAAHRPDQRRGLGPADRRPRVYVTGNFSQARPAGAAAGTQQTARSNLLAYNLDDGTLVTSWAPTLNGAGPHPRRLGRRHPDLRRRRVHPGQRHRPVPAGRARRHHRRTDHQLQPEPERPGAQHRRRRQHALPRRLVLHGRRPDPHPAGRGQRDHRRADPVGARARTPTCSAWSRRPAAARSWPAAASSSPTPPRSAGWPRSTRPTRAVLPWQATGAFNNYGPNAAIYVAGHRRQPGLRHRLRLLRAEPVRGHLRRRRGHRPAELAHRLQGRHLRRGPDRGRASTTSATRTTASTIGGNPEINPRSYQYAQALASNPDTGGRVNVGGAYNGQPAPELLHWQPTLVPGTLHRADPGRLDDHRQLRVRADRRRVPAGQRGEPAGADPVPGERPEPASPAGLPRAEADRGLAGPGRGAGGLDRGLGPGQPRS